MDERRKSRRKKEVNKITIEPVASDPIHSDRKIDIAFTNDISLCGLNDHVLDTMKRTYLYYKIGEDHIYRNVTKAIESIHKSAHEGTDEQHCPLKEVIHDEYSKGIK